MGDELGVIWLLAVGLGLSCLFGYLAKRAHQSPIIGYLLAGYVLGPNFPGFVADPYIAEQLATIGITLLMFAVGLQFHWKDLIAVQKIAVPGALVHAFFSIAAGALYSVYLGETWIAGMVTGLAICVSSTVVLVRVLADQELLHTKQGHIVVGWTIVEDLISIFGLLVLPSIAPTIVSMDTPTWGIIYQIPWIVLKICTLGLFVWLVGEKIISTILKIVSRTKSHELFTLAILAIAFLIAIGSSYLFGVSIVLGAFIAGTIVGKTDMSHQAAANALPMRDTFAVIFFLSVGMLFNPQVVMKDLPLFFGILAIVVLFRPLFAFFIVKLAKYPTKVAFTIALAIAQIGEYSFIVAEEGSRLRLLPDNVFDVLVACSFISIALNPMLFKIFQSFLKKNTQTDTNENALKKKPEYISDRVKKRPLSFLPRAIVVGFGPMGEASMKHLLQKGYHVVVIDRNSEILAAIHQEETETLLGDAAQFSVLEKAHIQNAKLLVITLPDFTVATSIIQTARRINPYIKVIARSYFQADLMGKNLRGVVTICDEEASGEKCIAAINQQLE